MVGAGLTPILISALDQGAGIERIDPREPGAAIDLALAEVVERLETSGRTFDRAALTVDPLMIGTAAVRAGLAHGCVAGAARTSADVARAALRVVGMAPNCSVLSGSFLMELPDGQALAFGDCAVVPEPDAMQLAEIASATAATFEALIGEPARVALLSFSTKGSADHATITTVRDALELLRTRRPDLVVDGELQFDAAFAPEVAAIKAPNSNVAGFANVFVFPNLAAANIAYKITERLGSARAYGPLFQGLAAPINDLSRGCSADDAYTVALITAMQALGSCSPVPCGGN